MIQPRQERPNPYLGLTYGRAMAHLAATYGERMALVFNDRRYSFADAKAEIDAAARRLAALGLRPGDTVALWMPNRPEFIWYWMAAAQSGFIAVFLNTRLKRDEFLYQIAQSRSRALITAGDGAFRDFLGELAAACPELRQQEPGALQLAALPDLRHLIALDRQAAPISGVCDWSDTRRIAQAEARLETDPDRPALVVYSSGTTALPKGAMLTHCIWRKAFDGGVRYYVGERDRLFLCVPLFGVLGCLTGVLMFWTHGGGVVLEERFDAGRCLALLRRESCTAMHMLPVMMDAIIAHPDFSREDFNRVRIGSILSNDPAVFRKAADRLGLEGAGSGYGMTETTGVVTRGWADEPMEERLKSHGKPLPGCAVRVVDPQTLKDLPPGEIGEIWIGGYGVMAGYFDKPRETAETITPDGWLRSGDAGYMGEDGSLTFLHRLKDGYKHNGFNVSTPEVEGVMMRHPAVAAAAVVPIPHHRHGEVGVGFVTLKPGAAASGGELMAFLRERLASFKLPAEVLVIDEFPRTAGTDKIQKFKLKERALSLFEAESDSAAQSVRR
ncbi:MAG: AMP-binding protein [Reyranellaceae bacterium]